MSFDDWWYANWNLFCGSGFETKDAARMAWQAATAAERDRISAECQRISNESDSFAASCADGELDSVIALGVAAYELLQVIRARGNGDE